jgi:hypothetical protein
MLKLQKLERTLPLVVLLVQNKAQNRLRLLLKVLQLRLMDI